MLLYSNFKEKTFESFKIFLPLLERVFLANFYINKNYNLCRCKKILHLTIHAKISTKVKAANFAKRLLLSHPIVDHTQRSEHWKFVVVIDLKECNFMLFSFSITFLYSPKKKRPLSCARGQICLWGCRNCMALHKWYH